MDTTTQIVLLLMIISLGLTLSLVGVMLFFVLKEFRQSVLKFNEILDDMRDISERLASGSIKAEEALVEFRTAMRTMREHAASPVGSMFGMFSLVRSLFTNKD